MFKLLILIGLGVAGYFIVKRILASDTGGADGEDLYRPTDSPQPAG